jgi:citrate lyase subunit beta / citryl-CoA lyase
MIGSDTEPPRLRRSLLFVPGAEPRKLERAREAGADTLLFDLEDSVAPQQKAAARSYVAAALRAADHGGAEAAVRVNAPGTADFEADVEAVVEAGGRLLMLPKSESAEGIARVAETLRHCERGRKSDGEGSVKLLLLVESPAGIAHVSAIGAASPRIEALCFGHADFSLLMGLSEADASRGIVYHARCALVIAATACGVAPIDSVHLAVKDEAAFREDAELGMRLGFEGKMCIHPRQVQIANEVYTPTEAQVDYALRVLEASERAETEGRGVFTLDDKMIDAPLVAVQRRVLERARRAGALPR